VVAGESLSAIAHRRYGDPALWTRIYGANRGLIGGRPNLIGVGMRLFVPPLNVEENLGIEAGKAMEVTNLNPAIQYPDAPIGTHTYPDGYLDPTYWEAIPGAVWSFRLKDGQSASVAIDSLFEAG
jgi:hypothetical protein